MTRDKSRGLCGAFGKEEIDLWRHCLKDYKVLWVGVLTPLSVLEEREKARGNRIHGSARAQYNKVHKGVEYDLEFDTHKESLEEIVGAIVKKTSLEIRFSS